METLDLILHIALAAVFAVAALAKLADRVGTRDTLGEFGVPAALAGVGAIALPLAEAATAALLLVPATATAGAITALSLLAAFSAAIAANLLRGRRPDCRCFGQVGGGPIGGSTLLRNACIAALAVGAVAIEPATGGASPVAWTGSLSAGEVAILALAIALASAAILAARLGLAILGQSGRLLLRIERLEAALAEAGIELPDEELGDGGLAVGKLAPGFDLQRIGGGKASLEDLLDAELPLVLIFGDPACGPCEALAPELARRQAAHGGELRIALLYAGAPDRIAAVAEEHGLETVLVDADRSVADSYGAAGTPAAVLLTPAGAIASGLAVGRAEIEGLLDRAIRSRLAPPSPVERAPLPRIELAELDGGSVALNERLDPIRDTVIVFWNPGCGFCRSMRDDLRAATLGADADRPAIVVVATGDEEDVRAEGFEAPVLLDPGLEASSAIGANGTPMALLAASDGTVRSGLAVGAADVLGLARRARLAAQ